ncbi:MAG TPA: hypothetical protein VKM55_08675 [Candidatus Lokiarchaeia archaeon]|nr:hypothetical protein [Candidatus Lokiarchaeia archaeon]
MKVHSNDIVIKEGQLIKNKIPNERILFLALDLGLIGRDNYETLKMIGESKDVVALMQELSCIELDTLVDTLQNLLKERLVEIS